MPRSIKNADLTYTGTFDIGVVGGTSVSINVTSDMSLSELATAITAQKAQQGNCFSVEDIGKRLSADFIFSGYQ